jgi:NADH dehydrogenase/NADH:ubiquinone oxidoreductase 75 kD subunit (chain G)
MRMMMVNIIIDGRKIKAKEGSTILKNARELKIDIPTLCHHDALTPAATCRLCAVEVKTNGKWKITTSCDTVVEQGMEIKTDSDRVRENRRLAAQLLYYKYPSIIVVRDMAQKLGVEVSDEKVDGHDCILCGLCVRACREVVDVSALRFRDRGLGRDIDETEIEFDPALCIGCGACAYACPTGYVKMESIDNKRIIWDRVFKMQACSVCGRYFAPRDQLEYINKKTGVPLSKLSICMSCR